LSVHVPSVSDGRQDGSSDTRADIRPIDEQNIAQRCFSRTIPAVDSFGDTRAGPSSEDFDFKLTLLILAPFQGRTLRLFSIAIREPIKY